MSTVITAGTVAETLFQVPTPRMIPRKRDAANPTLRTARKGKKKPNVLTVRTLGVLRKVRKIRVNSAAHSARIVLF